MASRTAFTTPSMNEIAAMVGQLTLMSGKDATTVTEVADALKSSQAIIMTVWDAEDPNGERVTGERGEMWLTEEDDEETQEEAVKPPTPAERFKARKAVVQSAVTPVLDSEGTPITVPVDYADPNKGRRELDANNGEHVISEESVSALINRINDRQNESESPVNNETPKPKSWAVEIPETHFKPFVEGERPDPGHTYLPEPEFMDAPPEGVHPHFWELYKGAATLNGRAYWGRKVMEQRKAFEEAQRVEVEQTPPAPVTYEIPIDPMTGQPFPF